MGKSGSCNECLKDLLTTAYGSIEVIETPLFSSFRDTLTNFYARGVALRLWLNLEVNFF